MLRGAPERGLAVYAGVATEEGFEPQAVPPARGSTVLRPREGKASSEAVFRAGAAFLPLVVGVLEAWLALPLPFPSTPLDTASSVPAAVAGFGSVKV